MHQYHVQAFAKDNPHFFLIERQEAYLVAKMSNDSGNSEFLELQNDQGEFAHELGKALSTTPPLPPPPPSHTRGKCNG